MYYHNLTYHAFMNTIIRLSVPIQLPKINNPFFDIFEMVCIANTHKYNVTILGNLSLL